MKIILLVVVMVFFLAEFGYCQDLQEFLKQAVEVYTGGGEASGNNLIGGFSCAGLIAGILFGSIGFIAFVYGKKNAEFKPMIMGLVLMVYPYLIRNTIALYLVGIALTGSLFFFRE